MEFGVVDSYYTSQLNVTLTSDVIGKTIITCINHLNLTSEVVQFSTTIKNTTGKYFMLILEYHIVLKISPSPFSTRCDPNWGGACFASIHEPSTSRERGLIKEGKKPCKT